MNEGELVHLLRARRPGRTRPSWRCLDEATLAALVDGTLSEDATARARSHLADCNFCLDYVAAAIRSQDAPLPEAPASLLARARDLVRFNDASIPVRTWGRRGVAVAAGLVLVASFLVWQLRTRELESPPPQVRSEAGQLLSPELLFPREGSIVARGKVEFRWHEVPEALYYEIQLLTVEGDVLWQVRVEELHAQPPDTVLHGEEQEVFVWVRAHVFDGRTVTSAPVGFRIDDKP